MDLTCVRCEAQMVTNDRWRDAGQEQRRAWCKAGVFRHTGRGLCHRCYGWLLRRGLLIDYARSNARWADVLEEYDFLHDPHRTQAENVRHLAPKLGVSEKALKFALVQAGVRSTVDRDGRLVA